MSKPETQEAHQSRFECRVRSRDNPGIIEVMAISASDEDDAVLRMQRQGYIVVSATEVREHEKIREKLKKIHAKSQKEEYRGRWYIPFAKPVQTRELIFFAVQLSTLLKSGIALLRALDILEKGTSNLYFRVVIRKIHKKVSDGHPLNQAIREHSRVFPWVWRNLIEVGEMAGTLQQVLLEIGRYQESAERIKGKIVSAMTYPAILLLAAVTAVAYLLTFIVPQFESIFISQGMALPFLTAWVVGLSKLIRGGFVPILILTGLGIVALKYFLSSPPGRYLWGRILLQFPIFGPLALEVASIRFARGLSTLLHAGIPLLKGLETAGPLCGNAFIETEVNSVREAVSQGHGLGIQLEVKKVFPVFMTQLISVGEETGEIESFLRIIADYYEERVEQFLSRISAMIEPLMLFVMAGIIGVIVIAMFLPIIQLSTGGS